MRDDIIFIVEAEGKMRLLYTCMQLFYRSLYCGGIVRVCKLSVNSHSMFLTVSDSRHS